MMKFFFLLGVLLFCNATFAETIQFSSGFRLNVNTPGLDVVERHEQDGIRRQEYFRILPFDDTLFLSNGYYRYGAALRYYRILLKKIEGIHPGGVCPQTLVLEQEKVVEKVRAAGVLMAASAWAHLITTELMISTLDILDFESLDFESNNQFFTENDFINTIENTNNIDLISKGRDWLEARQSYLKNKEQRKATEPLPYWIKTEL